MTAREFDLLWKIAAGILILLVGIIGYLFRRHLKRWDEDIEKLEGKAEKLEGKVEEAVSNMTARVNASVDGVVPDLRKEINELRNEWADLRAHIPEHYLPRSDFIRDNTILDGKVSALFRKFDRIEFKLDFLKDQIEKILGERLGGRASNGDGENDPGTTT